MRREISELPKKWLAPSVIIVPSDHYPVLGLIMTCHDTLCRAHSEACGQPLCEQRRRNLYRSHGQLTFPSQYEGRKPKIADEKDIV